MPKQGKALVFIAYAHQDKKLRKKLENHLTDLKYRGLITTWSDREIQAGEVLTQQINIFLNQAHIILFLVSDDFIGSHYYDSTEMKLALERRERGEVDIIPILLRPVLYESAPFAKLRVLPTNRKPVTLWRNRDLAFVDIACGIAEVAQKRHFALRAVSLDVMPSPSFTELAKILLQSLLLSMPWARRRKYYKEAIQAYRAALSQNPHDGTALRRMGNALYALKRFQEALNTFQQAIRCDPTPAAYAGLGDTFTKLKRYSEAVAAYQQAAALGFYSDL